MRDHFKGDVVDARKAFRGPIFQLREFTAVAFRKVLVRDANVFFDQVQVVEKPLTRGGGALAPPSGRHQRAAGFENHTLVVGQPGQEPLGRARCRQRVPPCKHEAVGFQLFGIEEFGT